MPMERQQRKRGPERHVDLLAYKKQHLRIDATLSAEQRIGKYPQGTRMIVGSSPPDSSHHTNVLPTPTELRTKGFGRTPQLPTGGGLRDHTHLPL
eukprot:CCRYP_013711-RA/>CCRYP_013711-RA protein AED:0.75 eAED:0.86 QI:0/0/0/1/0/0/2/0/94